MSKQDQLPAAFAELQRYVPIWAGHTVNDRIAARGHCSMEEITAFYDAAIVRAPEMLTYLEQFDLFDMPPEAGCLTRLLMGLAQASVAVEIQGQPMPPKTTFPLGVSLLSGVAPFG